MIGVIGTYNYTYGSDNQPNRGIRFSRIDTADTIHANVFVLNQDGTIGPRISIVPGDKIIVELECRSIKLLASRLNDPIAPDCALSSLNTSLQDVIMRTFEFRKIEVNNSWIHRDYEVVQSLKICDLR
jgi:hypothetical protein